MIASSTVIFPSVGPRTCRPAHPVRQLLNLRKDHPPDSPVRDCLSGRRPVTQYARGWRSASQSIWSSESFLVTVPRDKGSTLVNASKPASSPGTFAKTPWGPRTIRPVRTSYLA